MSNLNTASRRVLSIYVTDLPPAPPSLDPAFRQPVAIPDSEAQAVSQQHSQHMGHAPPLAQCCMTAFFLRVHAPRNVGVNIASVKISSRAIACFLLLTTPVAEKDSARTDLNAPNVKRSPPHVLLVKALTKTWDTELNAAQGLNIENMVLKCENFEMRLNHDWNVPALHWIWAHCVSRPTSADSCRRGSAWSKEVYDSIANFHYSKGFDHTSQDVTIELGYPLVDVDRFPLNGPRKQSNELCVGLSSPKRSGSGTFFNGGGLGSEKAGANYMCLIQSNRINRMNVLTQVPLQCPGEIQDADNGI
ncbi:hypothetical protein C8J57DRAFT_1238315 [Mycena rebaudengoi]|nr:hypothetical protein C8J57DRAFT_1238315 [Mycena rebaudengoi]